MIKRFLAWLKSIYFKPAAADIKTPEVVTMSEPLQDLQLNHTPVTSTIPDANQRAVSQDIVGADGQVAQINEPKLSPLEALKARDDEFVSFVVHGLSVLGAEAEAELVALKAKYF